jgi:GNAT superfamily N-acetyltransferase
MGGACRGIVVARVWRYLIHFHPVEGGSGDMNHALPQLSDGTIATIDRYWASSLGCPPAYLHEDGTHIVPLPPADDYWGIFVFRRGAAVVITVPAVLWTALETPLRRLKAADVDDEAAVRALVEHPIDRIVGPAYLGYADHRTFLPQPDPATRLLQATDAGAVEQLRLACSPADWEHGGRSLGQQPAVGRFLAGELVALASWEVWDDTIAHIYVVTHPAHRRRGYGKAVVSAIAAEALARGLVPQYRTLERNLPSVGIALALGFRQYATTLAVRLAPG